MPVRRLITSSAWHNPLDALQALHRHYVRQRWPGRATRKGPTVACDVACVWEHTTTPTGLAWLLLCDTSILNFTQAQEWVRQYASRWLIEIP